MVWRKKEAQYKLIAESGCIGYRLSSSQTLAIIEQNQLWREASVDSMEKSGTGTATSSSLVIILTTRFVRR